MGKEKRKVSGLERERERERKEKAKYTPKGRRKS